MPPPSPYRPEFEAALRLFARVSEAVRQSGHLPPVLVGGAAVELYAGGIIATGDFDLVATSQDIVEAAMRDHGFVKPTGPGSATRGWIHPELKLGFEIVSATLLDGQAERERLLELDFGTDGRALILSIEDMIADRMGQYASGTAPGMLGQARTLFRLHADADLDYMEHRIRHESAGDHGIADLSD